jgi:hypothetical protein
MKMKSKSESAAPSDRDMAKEWLSQQWPSECGFDSYEVDSLSALLARARALPASGQAAIEAEQRERLEKRFAGRPRPSREAFEDAGVPMLNEDTTPASGEADAPPHVAEITGDPDHIWHWKCSCGWEGTDWLTHNRSTKAAAPRAEDADAIVERCAKEAERWCLKGAEKGVADGIRALKGTLKEKK